MKEDLKRYTLRTSEEILQKLNYIADYNGRSGNKELEQMLLKYIAAFEKKHGEIKPEELQ